MVALAGRPRPPRRPRGDLRRGGIGDDEDPDDLDGLRARRFTWLSRELTREAFIVGERAKLSRNEFARAYGNARTSADERYIDGALWRSPGRRFDDLDETWLARLAGAVMVDRSPAAIVAASAMIAEVIDPRPGTDWVGGRLVEISLRRWRPAAVDVHRAGPSGTLRDELARAGVELADTAPVDYATACVALMGCASGGHRVLSGTPQPRRGRRRGRPAGGCRRVAALGT